MNKLSYKFFNKSKNTNHYNKMYKKKLYEPNVKRLEIIKKLLKIYKPKKIIDAGCGTGMPLIKIKKMGFNITGYDKSDNMIKEAKKNLKIFRFPENIICAGDFENPKHIKNNSVDCILGMGTFYYSKKFNYTLRNQVKKLKKNGRLIFSLRNSLFDSSTFNDYSVNFFSKLYNIDKFNSSIKKNFLNIFKSFNKNKNFKKNIDDYKVYSLSHNPLTIEKQVLNKLGLKLNGIYFYHYHVLPPIFENFDNFEFKKKSYRIEKPEDWKGYFLASAFVVDCQKT
tara:strand:- start:10057 stop:10899 length:843 start_codon:yes stop_codon:yes gene_type:complete